MKILLNKKFGIALGVVLAYLFTMGICISIILWVPYLGHREFLNSFADETAGSFAELGSLDGYDLKSLGVLVYDSDGACTGSYMPRDLRYDDDTEQIFGREVRPLVSRVLGGKNAVHVGLIPDKKLGVIVVGRPIQRGGAVDSAFFLIRDLHDLYSTLTGICIAYSLVFLIAAACIYYSVRKKRKYTLLQQNYVANVSHDLKSPITSIKALAETLHAGLAKDEETRSRYYGMIIEESVKLQHTVSDILELSAVQSRQTDLSKSTESLADIISPVVEKYKLLCYDMMIEFNVSAGIRSLPPVYTNAKSIARILDILLDNAVKFVGDNGRIWLDAEAGGKEITLCVRDNGIGIAQDDKRRIFDRFFMGDLSHNSKGSGLGLAIAQEILTALGEKIRVESKRGQGSAFYFTVHEKSF